MPVVRLEGVTKFFKYERKKRMAVQDIDLTIEQGEFVFLNSLLIAKVEIKEDGTIFPSLKYPYFLPIFCQNSSNVSVRKSR